MESNEIKEDDNINFWKFCNESPLVVVLCVLLITEALVRIFK